MPKKPKKSRVDSFRTLRELHCFEELDTKLKMNIAVEELARWLQEEQMCKTEVQRESLVRQLYRYKASLPPGEIAKVEPLFFRKAIEKMKRGINEIEELEQLYLFQLKRISIDAQTEEKINKLFSGTNKEMSVAVDILTKLIDKKMELGLMDREPVKHEILGGVGVVPMGDTNGYDADTKTKMGMIAGKLLGTLSKMMDERTEEEKRAQELVDFEYEHEEDDT